MFRFEISLLSQYPKVLSDHIKRVIFWNDLLYLFREGVSFEDFNSYKNLKKYMIQKYWELARVMRGEEEISYFVPRMVLARRVGDDELDPSHQIIIAEEGEN